MCSQPHLVASLPALAAPHRGSSFDRHFTTATKVSAIFCVSAAKGNLLVLLPATSCSEIPWLSDKIRGLGTCVKSLPVCLCCVRLHKDVQRSLEELWLVAVFQARVKAGVLQPKYVQALTIPLQHHRQVFRSGSTVLELRPSVGKLPQLLSVSLLQLVVVAVLPQRQPQSACKF
jgi:hypothetical protein